MKFRVGENPGLTARSWASENRSLVVRWASEISRNILLVIISSQKQCQNLRLPDEQSNELKACVISPLVLRYTCGTVNKPQLL